MVCLQLVYQSLRQEGSVCAETLDFPPLRPVNVYAAADKHRTSHGPADCPGTGTGHLALPVARNGQRRNLRRAPLLPGQRGGANMRSLPAHNGNQDILSGEPPLQPDPGAPGPDFHHPFHRR